MKKQEIMSALSPCCCQKLKEIWNTILDALLQTNESSPRIIMHMMYKMVSFRSFIDNENHVQSVVRKFCQENQKVFKQICATSGVAFIEDEFTQPREVFVLLRDLLKGYHQRPYYNLIRAVCKKRSSSSVYILDEMLAAGFHYQPQQIANNLSIARNTVTFYLSEFYEQFGLFPISEEDLMIIADKRLSRRCIQNCYVMNKYPLVPVTEDKAVLPEDTLDALLCVGGPKTLAG